MIPFLYDANETEFNNNGIGPLTDAVDCTVERELNGQYELELQYPVDGERFADLAQRCQILAKPDPVTDPQPFRIYRITKPFRGTVTVYARHIAYDLMGIPVSPFDAQSAAQAMSGMKINAAITCPFDFWTDKETVANMMVAVPASIWSLLGGNQGSVLDTYGGEYDFDRYNVKLYNHMGADRGVSIRYGKNLTTLEQDENCESCYTGVYPYWLSQDGLLVQLDDKIIQAPGEYGYVRILTLDFSQDWQEPPTQEQLLERAQRYITDNQIGVPDVSLTVGFVQLEQTEEYKGMALLERVNLGDTVSVEFPKLKVSATARAVAYRYKPLLDRYDQITLGKVKQNIAQTIANTQKEVQEKANLTTLQNEVSAATDLITGQRGGAIHIIRTANGTPYELVITDTQDIATATKVWRWNAAGLGYSSTGYGGPYNTAITQNGEIVADFITSGALSANIIKAGLLQSRDGGSFWNLDTGEVQLTAYAQKADLDDLQAQTDQIKTDMDAGVSQVQNASGRFDADGLTISRVGSEMKTQITDDGMSVYRNQQKMLSANSQGVDAENLHATTYLIVGKNSRFEDYGDNRTGCFWIGG